MITTAGDDVPAVRAKVEARGLLRQPMQHVRFAGPQEIPEPDGAVLAPARQQAAIGRETKAADPRPLAAQDSLQLLPVEVVEKDLLLRRARGGEPLAVGGDGQKVAAAFDIAGEGARLVGLAEVPDPETHA